MAKSLNYSLVKKPQNILKKRMQKHDKNKNKRQRFYFNSININIKLRKKLKKKIKFYKHACIDPNNVRLNVDKFISESKHLLPKSLGYHPDFIYKDLRQHIV